MRIFQGLLVALLAVVHTTQARQSPPFQLEEASVDSLHEAFKSGAITCRGVVVAYLARIDAYNRSGPMLNAVQNVNPKAAEEADRLDGMFKRSGLSGKLHCIPVLIKDQIETKDMPTTYGSAAFAGFIPQRDATAVERLKAAGAIILGKATMGEFANGYVGSAFGFMRNAYDPTRVASGSSGGTGTAVAVNFSAIGIGEDTGGSTRGPAAVNNLVGVRPTVSLISRHGVMPATPTRDTVGPITRTVRDAAIALEVLAGYDAKDPLTAYAYGQIPPSYTSLLGQDVRGLRIGVIRDPMDRTADPKSDDYKKVRVVMDTAIADLAKVGVTLVDPLPVPSRPNAKDAPAPAGSGANYETEQAIDAYLAQHPNAPVKTLKDILLSGKVSVKRARELMGVLGRSTADPAYGQAQIIREETRQAWLMAMADHRLDAVVYATFDHQPVVIPADVITNPDAGEGYGRGSNRSISPTLGWPAITVPAGFTTDKLPVGMELMGRPFSEATLLKIAFAYEQATRHRKPSPVAPPLRTN
jgi:amidase